MTSEIQSIDSELAAMATVLAAIKDLDSPSQLRVIEYVCTRLGIKPKQLQASAVTQKDSDKPLDRESMKSEPEHIEEASTDTDDDEPLSGISPIAQKWIKRNGLDAAALSNLFSLGVDEIDLVANTVPGKNMKEKMRNTLLLIGVASYLSGGVARVTYDKLKEACSHYDAYDRPNFATNLKGFAADASGSKDSGYTLTARGLTAATALIKSMMMPKSA